MRLQAPSHPGEIVREDLLPRFGLTVTRAAEVLGVTRVALSAMLNGRAGLSAEMALRLELAFGLDMETLLTMQMNHDIAAARRRARDIKVRKFVA
jgi:addiction module HigA family antidote